MATTRNVRMDLEQKDDATIHDDLAGRIEGYIERKACGRIRDLHVVCSENRIILRGRTRTYHAKQLAQEAVLDMTDGSSVLTNQIVVC
jgi:hypothetical protein